MVRRWLEQGDGFTEVDPPDFIFVGVLRVCDGCLMVQDVEAGQLVEIEFLEVPAQVLRTGNGGFPSGDEYFVFCIQVVFGDVLPDEPVPPVMRIFITVGRASAHEKSRDQPGVRVDALGVDQVTTL